MHLLCMKPSGAISDAVCHLSGDTLAQDTEMSADLPIIANFDVAFTWWQALGSEKF